MGGAGEGRREQLPPEAVAGGPRKELEEVAERCCLEKVPQEEPWEENALQDMRR